METNLFTSHSIKVFVAVQECATEQPRSNSTMAGNGVCGTCTHSSTAFLEHTTARRRCKQSIVIATDYNVGPEENVTQMMTYKITGHSHTAKA